MPEQASEFAYKVDYINNLITDISVFFTVAIVGTMIYFAIKYRKRDGKDHPTPRIEGSHTLEVLWTVVPAIICVFVAAYGYIVYDEMRTPPENALHIDVVGKKWVWDFRYENGKTTTGELTVPVDRPVKLVITSRDVLHSFFIPGMRTKMDAVPGHYTYQWFKPIKTGVYNVFCTEYCGDNHSGMLAKLNVVPQAEYDRWLNDRSEELRIVGIKSNPAAYGKVLWEKAGCKSCHTINGKPLAAPTWLKIYERKGKLADGSEYVANEEYIKNSIYEPNLQVVAGYGPPSPMQSYKGQLSPEDVDAIIAFMRTLDKEPAPEEPTATVSEADLAKMTPVQRGEALYKEKICVSCHSLDGSKLVGPTFKGLYGRKEKITGAGEITVDDAYIKNSIRNPMAQIVEGYPGAMPPYPPEQISDAQLNDLVEFLKSVK